MEKPALTQEEYNLLHQAEANLAQTFEWMDQLETCGADCRSLRAVVQNALMRTQNMKKNFPPNVRNMLDS